MEKWDAYNESMNKIDGMMLVREAPIPDGCFHLACEVLVCHTDGSYLIMQRDMGKPFGGLWEATAGGSALQGESPLECAIRELREETGIQAAQMIEVGKILHYRHKTYYVDFLCVTEVDKDSIRLQEGETIAYKWISGKELLEMTRKELATQRILNFINIEN